MRIACVHIPNFHVQVKLLADPELKRLPLIIGGLPGDPVIDCSEEAQVWGVTPGMSTKEAYHLCPEALLLPFEEDDYAALKEEVFDALTYFTLRIEATDAGTIYLDIARALDIYASEALLASGIVHTLSTSFRLNAKVGVGNSRFAAREAAVSAGRTFQIIEPGDEKKLLGHLPVERLPVDEDVKIRLHLLGLHTLRKVACLSPGALTAQFGGVGRRLWELANGTDDHVGISPKYVITGFEREVLCEPPLEVLQHLEGPLNAAVEEIVTEMKGMTRLCRKIRLTLFLRDGGRMDKYFILHTPTASHDEIMRRVWRGLEALSLESPVTAFTLSTHVLVPAEGTQETLFRSRSRSVQGFSNIKGYLKEKYGQVPVMRVTEADRDARLPERRFRFVEL